MPFISEAASAIKSRFGFHSRSASDTSELTVANSSIRSIGDWDDDASNATQVGSTAQSFEFNEDPSFWKDHNVQVIIRLRPLSSSEISVQGQGRCVRQESSQTITWSGHLESRFTFDLVADETVSQEKLFKLAGVPMVENCMGGYNSCMFAYGQTGSGKTHTMLGDIEQGIGRHNVNCGMTPRVFEYLFSRIQKEKEARKDEKLKFICKCSFLEIYNEQILDLLDPSSTNLQIREDNKKGIYVENIKEIEVASARDVLQQLLQGAANRKVASTNMNRASSRSHSVFTCIIESKWESQGITHHRFSRLNLVDLAGSERQKSSGAEGERLKEATNINKSLSTLGLVIMNLVSISNGKSHHVPYRDSKLTFLLQDSLGGNSKTIIIANISPSTCCSLETLSTLKFAQRAKFIKNNAIVNEDASGDVIAMRMQIQQLKKEVSRLQAMVNGGAENLDDNSSAFGFLASPGISKWEGLPGSFSPLTSTKKMTHKKDDELALYGALKREKDKDIALQALASENQAVMQLAKKREEKIKGLMMNLRFREAAVKRLESVASGKLSTEMHLLKEREEHLQEIEMLRAQVDRNEEATRFAMENLRLKEEIRRLKSSCEDGEIEKMKEEIAVLQNKLLEALDWKLMHESDPSVSKGLGTNGEPSLFGSNQEQGLPYSSINAENEFLRIQAIQNKAEMDTLGKKLDLCLDEKEKLERQVNDLVTELEERSKAQESQLPASSVDHPEINFKEQKELKTMVDVIGAASQREAEAHEMAIKLSKENDELKMKIKVLIEDNNKLIELYERATSERNMNQDGSTVGESSDIRRSCKSVEKDIETRNVEKLETQLMEIHEENERLMNLYEKAMQERDEFKRMLSEHNSQEKLVEVDGEKHRQLEPLRREANDLLEHNSCPDVQVETTELQKHISGEADKEKLIDAVILSDKELVRKKLHDVIQNLQDSGRNVTAFSSVEKAIINGARVRREIEALDVDIQSKQQQLDTHKSLYSEFQERRRITDKKLTALKYSLYNISSSIPYFDMRVARSQSKLKDSISRLSQKNVELERLQGHKDQTKFTQEKMEETEAELRNKIACLKQKMEEETRKQENERILFAIDNVEKIDSQKNWNLAGKATDLLKSEEEKIKLQAEMKLSRERLEIQRRELEDLKKKSGKLEKEIQAVQMETEKASRAVKEVERTLQGIIQEKECLLEMIEKGKIESESFMVEYSQHTFEADMKEAEIEFLNEELQMECRRKEELSNLWLEYSRQMTPYFDTSSDSYLSEKIEDELQGVEVSIWELKSLLEERYHDC